MAATLEQMAFVTLTVSNNDAKFYSDRKSAGVFAITNDMVDIFGVPTGLVYIPDLPSSQEPYTDFRFNKLNSYGFLIEAGKFLAFPDSDLEIFATAIAPYVGIGNTQEALNFVNALNLGDFQLSVSALCANILLGSTVDFEYYLTNTLKHNYLLTR